MPEKLEGDKSKGPGISRLKKLQKESADELFEPEMPPICAGHHLIELLWKVGPVISDGMGSGPLTHAEIGWFQHNTGIELSEWEASTIWALSRDFWSESHAATKRDCPAPWQPASHTVNLVAVGRSLEKEMERLIDL